MANTPSEVFEGRIRGTTDDAVFVRPKGATADICVPRSVCVNGAELEHGDTDIEIHTWWLRKKGLV